MVLKTAAWLGDETCTRPRRATAGADTLLCDGVLLIATFIADGNLYAGTVLKISEFYYFSNI
jgi:hypothetical protein